MLKFKTTEEYLAYLEEQFKGLNGELINDKGKLETAKYIQFMYENVAIDSLKSKRNKVIIDRESLLNATTQIDDIIAKTEQLLKQYNIELTKERETKIKLFVENIKSNKKIEVEIKKDALEVLTNVANMQVVFDESGIGFSTTIADLKQNLTGKEAFNFVIDNEDKSYALVFKDKDKKEVEKIPAPITLYFKAETPFATVEVKYQNNIDNWGGQFDEKNKLIFFATQISGLYTVVESDINISDISELTEDQQKMIRFLVSKGIFTVDNEKFNPNVPLTRYDFTTTLVKMFYALDRNVKTTFVDVEETNPYYPYIASAETAEIAAGIGDNLFAGDRLVTKEQMITFSSRILMDEKGYGLSTNPENYANFIDKDKIAAWALDHVRLAEEVGLINGGGELKPKGEITRLESAEMLYKLFMMLYEISPVEDTFYKKVAMSNDIFLYVGAGIGIVVILGVIIFVFKKKGKKSSETQNNKDETEDIESIEEIEEIEEDKLDESTHVSLKDEVSTIKCNKCGAENDAKNRFCYKCGNIIK